MTTTDPRRAEHDAVLSALSTRESTRHFAHAGVSVLLALITGGTAAKLWHDFQAAHPEWAFGAFGVAGVALLYALVRGAIAWRAHRAERAQLARLQELRKALGVDAPLSLDARAS